MSKTVSATCEAGFGDLIRVDDEIFPQDSGTVGEVVHGSPGEGEIMDGTLEPLRLGEDTDDAGSSAGVSERLSTCMSGWVNVAFTGTRALHLGHEPGKPREA